MLNWLEKRSGFISMTKSFLTEDVPGGASYWYVFGSATLFAMLVLIVTGIFLTIFYAPSADTAWESTKAVYANPFQHYVLSIHFWAASAMIALVFLHLLQVVIWGAYKAPRELQWIVGVLLFLATLGLGLTGYLLPWDMNAYFASQVAINIAGTTPVLGPAIQDFLQGGPTMGTFTINRFFGIHVWLLPALLILLTAAHLIIFRHNGAAGPIERRREDSPGRFWPNQLFMDTVISFVVFILILALAAVSPPFLDTKADPNNVLFVPYPAWYFLALFGLLNLVPPQFELFGTILLPGLAVLILFLLPWLDRTTVRTLSSRRAILGAATLSVACIVALTVYSQASIAQKQAASAALAVTITQPVAAQTSAQASLGAGPASRPAAALPGAKIFTQSCQACHGPTGMGVPGSFPPLAKNSFVTGDPKKVIGVVLNGLQGSVTVNGQSFNGTMPPWKRTLSDKDIAAVITYIRSSWGNAGGGVTQRVVAAVKH